jgi:hypothetical protein
MRGPDGAPAVAFDVHFRGGGVVDQTVRGGQRRGRLGKDISPRRSMNAISCIPTLSQAILTSRTNSVSTQSSAAIEVDLLVRALSARRDITDLQASRARELPPNHRQNLLVILRSASVVSQRFSEENELLRLGSLVGIGWGLGK